MAGDVRVLDKGVKANLEVRVTNKETGKSASIAIYSKKFDEEKLRDRLKAYLFTLEHT